jgi:hypothetical protein
VQLLEAHLIKWEKGLKAHVTAKQNKGTYWGRNGAI